MDPTKINLPDSHGRPLAKRSPLDHATGLILGFATSLVRRRLSTMLVKRWRPKPLMRQSAPGIRQRCLIGSSRY
jgi:hypothetical protein